MHQALATGAAFWKSKIAYYKLEKQISNGFDEYSVYADSYFDSIGGMQQAEISRLMPERFYMFGIIR
jgi:hypothetical protein